MRIAKLMLMTVLAGTITAMAACSGRKTNNQGQDSGATTVGLTDSSTDSSKSVGRGAGSHQDSAGGHTSTKDTTKKQ